MQKETRISMYNDLFSERTKKINREDVFKNSITLEFKNTIFYFMQMNLTLIEFSNLYRDIILHCGIKRNIDEMYLINPDTFPNNFISGFEKLMDNQNDINFYLDFIELFLIKIKENKLEIVSSINKILYKYSMGYQVDDIKYQIIIVDSKHIYQKTVKQAFLLLNDDKFKNADAEYRKAFEELKNANYEAVLVEANKAFESTMKIICVLKNYGLPKNHNSSALIAHLRKNNFIENFQDEKFNGLAKTLQSISIIRNNQAGHGQGLVTRSLSSIFAEYALHVTASNILLLVGIYKESLITSKNKNND